MARLKIGYLLLLFFVGLLPFAAHFLLHYPDERHYTDGAIHMVRSGNWLVPKTPDGVSRYKKPILAYWLPAASYEIGGINVLASRLPFLLVGCGTLWLTYLLALRLYQNSSAAVLAALILLSHPQFILCSTRSLPDGLLCFSISLGAYGFMRLIVLGEKSARAFWAAYLGAGLAVLSKGLLGVGLVAFAWTFAWSQNRKLSTLRALVHWPSMLAGFVVAFGWFGVVLTRHGREVWADFWGDQVSSNLGGAWWTPGYRMLLFVAVLAVNFLPWTVTFLEALVRKRLLRLQGPSEKGADRFILSWTAFLIFVFGLGTNVSTRYLLPAAPLFAIFLAWKLQNATGELIFSIQRLAKFFFAIFAAAALVVLAISAQLAGWETSLLLLIVVLLLTGALALAAFRHWELTPSETLAIIIFLFFPLVSLALQQLLLPSKAGQIVSGLQRFEPVQERHLYFVGSPADASQIHVCSKGKIQILAKRDTELPTAKAGNLVVFPESKIATIVSKGYHPGVPVAEEFRPQSAGEFVRALLNGKLTNYRDQNVQRYFVATPQ